MTIITIYEKVDITTEERNDQNIFKYAYAGFDYQRIAEYQQKILKQIDHEEIDRLDMGKEPIQRA